jgi:2-dehydro-3-deoxyphosphogluconate aldolase / (4S)-4-hydroxy-2-oxoglutarate aldolase
MIPVMSTFKRRLPAGGRAKAAEIIDRLGAARVIPVVRVDTAAEAVTQARSLLARHHGVIELTATTADWQEALAELRGAALAGVGTVTTAADAEAALELGADFLVSPYPAPQAAAVADAAGAVFIEGGFTPDQIARAAERGIAKLFPAHVGGIPYLRSLLGVLPGARIVPSGGIDPHSVEEWLDAGAFAVGGSTLT